MFLFVCMTIVPYISNKGKKNHPNQGLYSSPCPSLIWPQLKIKDCNLIQYSILGISRSVYSYLKGGKFLGRCISNQKRSSLTFQSQYNFNRYQILSAHKLNSNTTTVHCSCFCFHQVLDCQLHRRCGFWRKDHLISLTLLCSARSIDKQCLLLSSPVQLRLLMRHAMSITNF